MACTFLVGLDAMGAVGWRLKPFCSKGLGVCGGKTESDVTILALQGGVAVTFVAEGLVFIFRGGVCCGGLVFVLAEVAEADEWLVR